MIRSVFPPLTAALAAAPAAVQVGIGLLVSAPVRDGRSRRLPAERGHG